MELKREIQLTVVVLTGILLLVAMGSVLLFDRMAPAIEHILEENVYSLEAVEEMLVELDAGDDTAAFEAALERARQNITEDRERPVVATIEQHYRAALAGDPAAGRAVAEALRTLGHINRSAAVEADQAAKRLGISGAWAVVFLGLIGFAWGLLALRRFHRRVTRPVREIHEVLHAHSRGESLRRAKHVESVRELEEIQRHVNALLDARTRLEPRDAAADLDRGVLLYLLEQRPGPAFVVDDAGAVGVASKAGLERLAAEDGEELRDRLRRAARGEEVDGLQVTELPDLGAALIELDGARAET